MAFGSKCGAVFGSRSGMAWLLVMAMAASVPVGAWIRPSITFENLAGEDALVRLVGPTSLFEQVPNGAARTVEVRGGRYELFVRYGRPGRYRYTRGEPFTVAESADSVEQVTITLHEVVNGNYGSEPSSEAEFNRGR